MLATLSDSTDNNEMRKSRLNRTFIQLFKLTELRNMIDKSISKQINRFTTYQPSEFLEQVLVLKRLGDDTNFK